MSLTNSKIEDIKNCLPQMGLVDRFFFLINKLYNEYFDNYSNYFGDGWDDKNLRNGEANESLYRRFLQTHGNRKLKSFILLEIRQLAFIFKQKYSFELSYLYNPHHTREYYLSRDAEFLLLALFMFDEKSFKAAVIHELSISEIEDRGFLLSKYQGVISEITYRINADFAWDAGLESVRTVIVDEIVFPERNVIDLNNLTSFLMELQETSFDVIPHDFLRNGAQKIEEKLVLDGIGPVAVVNLFAKVLNRADNEYLIKDFVATSFKYNFRKYCFEYETPDDILQLRTKEETILICQTILLMMSLGFVQHENASFITRVLIAALRREGKNKRVWLSDDLRKYISEWRGMSPRELSVIIGFSSKEDFIYSINSGS